MEISNHSCLSKKGNMAVENILIDIDKNKLNPFIKDGIDHEYQCQNCGRYYRTEIKRCICGIEFTKSNV